MPSTAVPTGRTTQRRQIRLGSRFAKRTTRARVARRPTRPRRSDCLLREYPEDECDEDVASSAGLEPPDTTLHVDQGWCWSTLDLYIGCASSATDCWNQCEAALGDDLVAVDVWGGGDSGGSCYCQDECRFMADCDEDDDEDGGGGALPGCNQAVKTWCRGNAYEAKHVSRNSYFRSGMGRCTTCN